MASQKMILNMPLILDELIHKHEAAIDQARASKESELLEV